MAGLNWLGVNAGVQAAQGYYDKHLERERTKKKDKLQEERHGLFVRSTEQEMGLRNKREERAGAQEERAAKRAGLDFDITSEKHEDWRDTAGHREKKRDQELRAGDADIRAKGAAAAASGQRATYYATQNKIAALDHELKLALKPLTEQQAILTAEGNLEEAARVREQAGMLTQQNRSDTFIELYKLAAIDGRAAAEKLRAMPLGFDQADDIIFEDGKMVIVDKDRQPINGVDARGNAIPGERDISSFESLEQRRQEQRIADTERDSKGRLFSVKQDRLVEVSDEELRDAYQAYVSDLGEDPAKVLDYDTWFSRNYRSGRQQARIEVQQDKTRRSERRARSKLVAKYGNEEKPPKTPQGASTVLFRSDLPHAQLSPKSPLPRWFQVILVDGKKKLREMP